ncbi:WD40 repeat-like protein [Neoconidiobolus thromboides FSU 785]|nr:WD40 repeat-like protein [Neoconidiobolus thromboides FSU 785]
MEPNSIVSHDKVDTIYSADSIEWIPSTNQRLIIGTYQLIDNETQQFITPENPSSNQEKAIRKGNLQLYKVNDKNKLVKGNVIEGEASLDIKWRYSPRIIEGEKNYLLAQADASGQVKFYSYNEEKDELLKEETLFEFKNILSEKENLALSLDWSDRINNDDCKLSVSFSDGSLSVIELNPDTLKGQIKYRWLAHSLEAWITGFNYHNTNVVYSGADDALFKSWDLRLLDQYTGDEDIVKSSTAVMTNKSHMAGVCSLHSNPNRENYIATGSYDETVRIFDTRKLKVPVSEINVDGGVWRVKWHSTNPSQLIVAAMHDNNNEFSIQNSFMDHTSIAYGVDWSYNPTNNQQLIGSVSFYDHSMYLWSINKSS